MKQINLNDDDWVLTLSGKNVKGMNRQERLEARLVRASLQARIDNINKNISLINHDNLYDRFLKRLHQNRYLEKPHNLLRSKLLSKKNWFMGLVIGASAVYATKEFLRSDMPQNSIQPLVIEQPLSKTKFWGEWFDPQGGFTGFWSKIQLQMIGHIEKPIKTSSSYCNSENLSFEGCSLLAKAGDSAAQFNLGLMYEKGINVTQSYEKAFIWYKKSAALGNKPAIMNRDYLIENRFVLD